MQKKSDRKLIEDFSNALEQGQAVVYRRNFDSVTYEYMGEYIKGITGYSREELTPDIWDSLVISTEVKGELTGLNVENCHHLVRTGKVDRRWQADVQIRNRAGDVRWVNDMSTVLRDEAGECYGSLGVMQDITERKKAEQQLAKLTEQLRIRNEEIETDIAMAREIQQALISTQSEYFPSTDLEAKARVNFHHRYIPSTTLAGDFFEILPLSEYEVGVLICDVIGHGVRAALLTTFLRGLLEELMSYANDPGTLLGKINSSFISVFGGSDSTLFATACYIVFNVETGQIRFSNAGHPMPLRLQPKNGVVAKLERLSQQSEPALGIIPGFTYSTEENVLPRSDSICLYTDGIFEAYNEHGDMYGEEGLAAFIRQHLQLAPEMLLDEVIRDVRRFRKSEVLEDDACLLTVVPAPANSQL